MINQCNTQKILLMVVFGLLLQAKSTAKDLTASLAIIPVQSEIGDDGKPKGTFVEIVKAMSDVYEEGDIIIEQYPFARSIANVISGKADFHVPLIKTSNVDVLSLPFVYSTEATNEVVFVLYTRADVAPIDKSQIKDKLIETQRGHKELFKIKVSEVDSIEQGIRKVVRGRNDGFIMAQGAVDSYIQKNKIKNIRRTFFAVWKSYAVIAKGSRQKEIDDILSKILRKLKASGKIQKIMEKTNKPYIEWQPYKMKW